MCSSTLTSTSIPAPPSLPKHLAVPHQCSFRIVWASKDSLDPTTYLILPTYLTSSIPSRLTPVHVNCHPSHHQQTRQPPLSYLENRFHRPRSSSSLYNCSAAWQYSSCKYHTFIAQRYKRPGSAPYGETRNRPSLGSVSQIMRDRSDSLSPPERDGTEDPGAHELSKHASSLLHHQSLV